MPFSSMMQLLARLRPWATGALVMAGCATATVSSAFAVALDENRCTEIQAEREKLVAAGVRDNWLKGPAWARDNLPRTALDQIAQLIYLDEQLTFRCPLKFSTSPLKPSAPEPEEAAEKEEDAGESGDDKPRTMPLPSRRPPANANANRDLPGRAGKSPAAGPAKAVSTTKNDAYIPPPPAVASPALPAAPAGVPGATTPPATVAPTPPLRGSLGYAPANNDIPSWAQQIGKNR